MNDVCGFNDKRAGGRVRGRVPDFKTNCYVPVSYTHLDVYKRQVEKCFCSVR